MRSSMAHSKLQGYSMRRTQEEQRGRNTCVELERNMERPLRRATNPSLRDLNEKTEEQKSEYAIPWDVNIIVCSYSPIRPDLSSKHTRAISCMSVTTEHCEHNHLGRNCSTDYLLWIATSSAFWYTAETEVGFRTRRHKLCNFEGSSFRAGATDGVYFCLSTHFPIASQSPAFFAA